MPTLMLKALDCNRPHGSSVDTNVRVHISVDGGEKRVEVKVGSINFRERRLLNDSIPFTKSVKLHLTFRIDKQIGHSHTLTTDTLPHDPKGKPGFHRGKREFRGLSGVTGAHYVLWYEVIPDGMSPVAFHRSMLDRISFRRMLGRTGRGFMTSHERSEVRTFPPDKKNVATYRCSEVISVRDIFSLHRNQDGEKGNTIFVRRWIAQHCNIWGEESVIPIAQLPEGEPVLALASVPNWRPVRDEQSSVLAGLVTSTSEAALDNAPTHMSRDWTFNIVPSPAFSYMLAYTAKTKSASNRRSADEDAESSLVPLSHNEWETGSMPEEWRPRLGEFVTIFGRHVFDLGHLEMTTEIHPPHTIVREFTLDDGKTNRAIIGMGFSGGFPGSIKAELSGELNARWNAEFGGFLKGLNLRNRRCWATNLKNHPLRIKFFPPVPRPNTTTATLDNNVVTWKLIRVRTNEIDKFLGNCKSPAEVGPLHHSFDEWFPDALERSPPAFKPVLNSQGDHFDLTVDLSDAEDIPVAYFAIVDCFWRD